MICFTKAAGWWVNKSVNRLPTFHFWYPNSGKTCQWEKIEQWFFTMLESWLCKHKHILTKQTRDNKSTDAKNTKTSQAICRYIDKFFLYSRRECRKNRVYPCQLWLCPLVYTTVGIENKDSCYAFHWAEGCESVMMVSQWWSFGTLWENVTSISLSTYETPSNT